MAHIKLAKVLVICISFFLFSCNNTPNQTKVTSTVDTISSIQKWQNMKFGLFVHWGVYSVPAGVWKGEEIEKLGEQIMRHADISIPEYEAIAKQFNPVNFDADAVVKMAKNAGMKYVILTAKHHDGFSMFKSEVSDYNVVDYTPYKKDILKELADACKSNGLKLGLYYSTPDWHFNGPHPERNPVDGKYSVFGKVSKANEDFQVAQLKELLTNYGDIVELFFDMGEPTEAQSKRFKETVKSIQPDCLINGRVMNNQGDFITMPDNHLPDLPIYDVAWETPGTFYHTWGYKSWVKGSPLAIQVKKQIRNLSKITCMGGNYLLNVGPKSDGTVLDYEQNVLAGIGNWMKIHNEAIFDTEVNPFQKLPWGYASVKSKDNKLYLHVFDWPQNGVLKIPGFTNTIKNAYHLSDQSKSELSVISLDNDKNIEVGMNPSNLDLSIVVVEYEGELSVEQPVIIANAKGNIFLKDKKAIKHGRYGMLSYRSIIKDYHRSWDIEVVEDGVYEVELLYKMKYKSKDFVLKTTSGSLPFTLTGKAPEKELVQELFDGNETQKKEVKTSLTYGKKAIGTMRLYKGKQTIELHSAQDFEFQASFVDYKAQDRKNRGINADIKVIRLKKK